MSIWDDLQDVVDTVGETAKSMGGVPLAVPGLIWDVATSPKDIVHDLTRAAGRATDPLVNEHTLTGRALAPVLELGAMVYREGISEPIATGNTVFGHAIHERNPLEMFDSSTWSEAYETAQNRSIGQSWFLAGREATHLLGPVGGLIGVKMSQTGTDDPLTKTAYAAAHDQNPLLTSILSGSVDAAASWYIDPLVVLGKAAKAGKVAKSRKISTADLAVGLRSLTDTERVKKYGIGPFRVKTAGLKTRVDALNGTIEDGVHTPGWLDGKSADQVHKGLLLDEQANGWQMASILADTNRIENVADRINTRRLIQRTQWGDASAFAELEKNQKFIADTIRNLDDGAVTGSEASVIYDAAIEQLPDKALYQASSKAENIAEAERQIGNLPGLRGFLESAEQWHSDVLKTFATLDHAPQVTAKGERRIAREVEGHGLLRDGTANTKLGLRTDPVTGESYSLADDILNRKLQKPLERIYTVGQSNMPLRYITGLTVKTLHAGPQFTDSFRNVRPEFVVNVNDADDVYRNVDNYLRRAGSDLETRSQFANSLAAARTPIARARVIAKAERVAQKALFAKHGIEDADGFLVELHARGEISRAQMLTSLQGRAYSATMQEQALPLAPQRMSAWEKSPRVAKMHYAAKRKGQAEAEYRDLRVDQFDDDGIPTALPFLDTQDVSLMPMLPLDEIDKVLKKHSSVFRAAARAWKEDRLSAGVPAAFRRSAGTGLDLGIRAKDGLSEHLVPTLDALNRAWKFSVLLRLGYLQRIVTEDWLRGVAKFGANGLVAGLRDGIPNLTHNKISRRYADAYAERNLRAEHALLENHIGSEELFARNQEAWAEIVTINKKLNRIKSKTRRAELEAKRQVLMENYAEDLFAAKARFEAITRALESGEYKNPKRFAGREGSDIEIDGSVVHIPGAYEGDYGEVFRALNSSRGSWEDLAASASTAMQQNLSRSGSFRVIRPDEGPVHTAAWEHAINYQLRTSKLAKIIIDGGSADDVVKFLRTAEGRKLVKQNPYHGSNPERWAHDIERMVDEYIPAEIRDTVRKRPITAKELEATFKDQTRRPDVHGAGMDLATGSGQISDSLNRIYSGFYGWVSKKNDSLSRHPMFVALYRDEMARQVPLRIEAARAAGRQLDQSDIEAAVYNARQYAQKQVNRTLFDVGGQTEIAHFMRFVSPFFGAHMEALNRWWGITSKDPSVAVRFFKIFDGPRNLGLVVDSETGAPVEPGAPIDDTHMILWQIPQAWGGPDPEKFQTKFKTPESAFNLVLQGGGLFNPGFGPLVQYPANFYAVKKAGDKEIQSAVRAILPYGAQSDSTPIFLPGAVRSGYTVAAAKFFDHHSKQYIAMQNQIARDDMVRFQMDHGRPPTGQEIDQIMEEAGEKTLHMGALKWLSTVVSPASVQIQSDFAPQLSAYRRLQEQARAEDWPPFKADEEFIEKFGDAFFPLMRSASRNNARLSQSAEAVAQAEKHRGLLNRIDPKMYRAALGFEAEGEYSSAARAWMTKARLGPGSEDTFLDTADPRQAAIDTTVSQGWYDYNKFTDQLQIRAQDHGWGSYIDQEWYQNARKKGLAKLAEKNPLWWQEYNSFNPAEYETTLTDLNTIATDPGLNADARRTDVKVLQQYLLLRQQIQKVLKQREAWGGSSSPQAVANQDVLRVFTQQVGRLVESNTFFHDYLFDGVIDHDPYLLDNALPSSLSETGALA